jgi:hypothetical protein
MLNLPGRKTKIAMLHDVFGAAGQLMLNGIAISLGQVCPAPSIFHNYSEQFLEPNIFNRKNTTAHEPDVALSPFKYKTQSLDI